MAKSEKFDSEKFDEIYEDVKSGKIGREEGIKQIQETGDITRVGAEDTLDRWPEKKNEPL